jgi:hypothetical protein
MNVKSERFRSDQSIPIETESSSTLLQSNKLSQFWQELKRRNVVRVITVYAGAAFVILELTDINTEPLKLPLRNRKNKKHNPGLG